MIHSYPWYFDDWLLSRSRMEMTLAERGLYRDILDLCYRDGSVPDDPTLLRRMIAAEREEFEAAWPAIRCRLVPVGGGLCHPRTIEELPDLHRLKEIRSVSAKSAARKRWAEVKSKPIDAQRNAPRMPDACEDDAPRMPDALPKGCATDAGRNAKSCLASASASASVKTPLPPSGAGVGDLFGCLEPAGEPTTILSPFEAKLEAVVNSLYSRHVVHPERDGTGPAEIRRLLKAIVKRQRSVPERMAMLEQIDTNHAAHWNTPAWQREGGKYVKALSNWLAPTMNRYLEPPAVHAAPPVEYVDATWRPER